MASHPRSLPSGMQHVERRELYTSFSKRLAYLHSFLEFGQDDADALIKAQPFVKSLIPTVAEAVYNKILENDITAQALITQSTIEECELDEDDFYDKHSMNVKCRHMFVRWYLTKVNSDPTNPEYWDYMHKLGAMHNGFIRRQPLKIDVIHFSLMLGYIQTMLNDAIITSASIPMAQKSPLIKAWTKIFWIQNDLFTKWHVKDGNEYGQSEMRPEAMKIMTETITKDSVMRDEDGKIAQCPFSNMAKLKSGAYVYKQSPPVIKPIRIGSIESIYSPGLVGSAPN